MDNNQEIETPEDITAIPSDAKPATAEGPSVDVLARQELESVRQQHMAALAREALLKRQLEEVAKQVVATGDQVQVLSRILGVAPSLQ
jgi:transketolase